MDYNVRQIFRGTMSERVPTKANARKNAGEQVRAWTKVGFQIQAYGRSEEDEDSQDNRGLKPTPIVSV